MYVQPSRHEGYPITLIEARTLCKPIVATNIESIKEQIIDGKNGCLVNLEKVELADKIFELMDSEEKIKHMVNALETEKIDFSADYSKIADILEEN